MYTQNLYSILDNYIRPAVIKSNNRHKKWVYGYNKEYDVVIISKSGEIGEVYEIQGLKVALPLIKDCYKRSKDKSEQYWEKSLIPSEIDKIKSVNEWNKYPDAFKNRFYDYIDGEFKCRDEGFSFYNDGAETYITGSHYVYLQWTKIDVGAADYREANRIFFYFWEACKADYRSYGMCYLKNRRSGFSFMASAETVNQATISKDSRFGILSKTGADAKKMFTDKVVPISLNYPFFFKPTQDGMERPKTELSYKIPSRRLTRNSIKESSKMDDFGEGLDTTIDWKNTGDNSYDGEKLQLLVHDECYHPDTTILNADMQFTAISNLNVGDKVMVEGGMVKTIKKRVNGTTESYLINQPYGNDYIVTENHRLVIRDNYGSRGNKEYIYTAKEYFNFSEEHKRHTTRVTSKGIQAEDKFDGMPPYLLGLWLGDGRKNGMTIIVNVDEEPEILQYLIELAEMMGVKFGVMHRKECTPYVVEFSFLGSTAELKKIGVYKNKHIPEQYLTSSIETRLQILAGLVDTDGHSDKNKGCIEFGMSDKNLIEQIHFLALSCGLSASSVSHRLSNYNTDSYRVNISGDLSSIPILTNKKSFQGYKPVTTGRRNKIEIKYVGKNDYVGIQLDADNDEERKLILSDFTLSMNSGKWERPDNITNNWRVTKTCLRLGSRIVGKCMMGSTSNALAKGGENFKKLYEHSDVQKRNRNGQTSSGLYSLFVPMEWNYEGFIDKYGIPVFNTPKTPAIGPDGGLIDIGVIEYWENEVGGLKNDQDGLNEYYRQFPRTTQHAFRDEAKQSLFNLTKIYQQIDYNEDLRNTAIVTTGSFAWENGVQDSIVVFNPHKDGRFKITWVPPKDMQNRVIIKNGMKHPGNEHCGAFGCDSYDISGTVDQRGSNGALSGLTKFSMEDVPPNHFFLEYIARPQTAEIFFEDVLMACVFYGMPILAENNKPRLLYHFKRRGYRGFSINRPDKIWNKLSVTEKEIGGIPNSSEDIKQAHAAAIESYIETYVGLSDTGYGDMYFQRTLEDWARFNINNRTSHDASISSGLALMACNKQRYAPANRIERQPINMGIKKYNNDGSTSKIII